MTVTQSYKSLLCKFLLTFMPAALFLLPACIDDIPVVESEQIEKPVLEGEKVTRYFSFSLDMVDGVPYTRDESSSTSNRFEDGTTDESQISNLLIIFYDSNGNYLAHFDSNGLNNREDADETPSVEELKWKTTITVPVETYQSIEKYAFHSYFVIVNYDQTIRNALKASTASQEETCISRNALLSLTTSDFKNTNGFVMTTPGHYDSHDNYLPYGVLPADKTAANQLFYNSRSAAEAHPLNVYVERLAARVDLAKIGTISGVEVLYGTDVYELTFTPTAWGLEATEKTEYLSKHAPDKSSYNNTAYYPSDFYDWLNYTDNTRCFWAESPVYVNDENALNTTNKYPATGLEIGLSLNYLKFSEIENEFSQKKYECKTYTTERTFSALELKSPKVENPYAVPTSFVLKGQYTGATWKGTDERGGENVTHPDESVSTGNQAPTSGSDLSFNDYGFYLRDIDMERTDNEAGDNSKRYQYRLYRENNGASSDPSDDLYIALLKEQHIIFVKSEETYTYIDEKGQPQSEKTEKYLPVKESTEYKANGNTYVIMGEHIFNITNTKKYWTGSSWITASNTFTLQLKDTYTESVPDLYYGVYNGTNGQAATYTLITSANKSSANSELQKQLGYARKYFKGMAFFYSPITHYTGDYAPFSGSDYKGLFNYETETKDGVTSDYKKDEKGRYIPYHKTGDFGVVRNHIYNFSIEGISSLGYGIPDEDVIPLPEPSIENDIYQFDLQLKILPWNLFEYTLDI